MQVKQKTLKSPPLLLTSTCLKVERITLLLFTMKKPIHLSSSPIQKIEESFLIEKNISLDILREDLNHPEIQGNKLRKLHYNLLNAKKKGNQTLLTFGGAYSNHIAAVAAAGKEFGFHTIGLIRGEETTPLNPTLALCVKNGMELHYIDRTTYRIKHTQDFKDYLRNRFGTFYLIPEGGTNYYAVNGCMEIIKDYSRYDYICCPVGTGGTIAGITLANANKSKILGFSALKGGDFLTADIHNHIQLVTNDTELTNELMQSFELNTEFHFGGYAKFTEELLIFVRNFHKKHQVKWDTIYNGKMAFGVYELIKADYFPANSSILLIHTGGLQSVEGIEQRNNIKVYED